MLCVLQNCGGVRRVGGCLGLFLFEVGAVFFQFLALGFDLGTVIVHLMARGGQFFVLVAHALGEIVGGLVELGAAFFQVSQTDCQGVCGA